MIEEDYVSFETAKLLKERGFTENTIGTYNDDGVFYLYKHEKGYNHNHLHTWYSAPTLQMAMKWLREEYGIHILFDLSAWETYDWYYVYKGNRYHYDEREFDHNTYEEACEAVIKYCLENLI